MTPKELKFAWQFWWMQNYKHRRADKELKPFIHPDAKKFELNQTPKLQQAREALLLSQVEIAKRLQMRTGSYKLLEDSESKGAISLITLAKAASALDCELVYAIRPKRNKLYSEILWEKILPAAREDKYLKLVNPKMKATSLSMFAQRCIEDAKFAREAGWSRLRKK